MDRKSDIDFIGLGTPKAATTWIHQCLKEHPQICTSTVKEIAFFLDENYGKGAEWYISHFKHCEPDKIRGEFSPDYLHTPNAAERMHSLFPNAKLIVSLRNPIERLISTIYFEYSMGRTSADRFEEIPKGRIENAKRKGLYYSHLEKYLALFPREQVLILIYEDIEKDPLAFIQKVYRFLGVDDSFVPPSAYGRENMTAVNATRIRSLKKMYYWLQREVPQSAFGPVAMPLIKYSGLAALGRGIMALNTRKKESLIPAKKEIPTSVREELRTYFSEDTRKLEALLGRDLSFWN